MDSEFIQIEDSQGVELQIGDKVLVSLGKYFAQRYVVDIKPNIYTRPDGSVITYHSKIAIREENSNMVRWTYANRVVKYDWT